MRQCAMSRYAKLSIATRSGHHAEPEAALQPKQAALRIAAKGVATLISRVRTNLTQLTRAYEFDQRIA